MRKFLAIALASIASIAVIYPAAAADGFATTYNVFGGSPYEIKPDPSLAVFSTAWDKLVSEQNGRKFEFSIGEYEKLYAATPTDSSGVLSDALRNDALRKFYSTPEAIQEFERIYNYGVQSKSPVAAVPIGTAFDLYLTGKTINAQDGIPTTEFDEKTFRDPSRMFCIWLITCGWPPTK